MTQLYDPARRTWPLAEKLPAPWPISKYTTYLCPTPGGMVAWAPTGGTSSPAGIFRFENGKEWKTLPTEGEALPTPVTDGSTVTYDSKRDQLIFTTTPQRGKDPAGQVWTCDLKTGKVRAMNPQGMEKIQVQRFAREAVYLPKADLVMMGYHLNGATVTPFYDVANNRWLTAEVPGSEFYLRNRSDGSGASVDLGLAYDARRDLVWGVMCKLTGTGALNVLRIDADALKLTALK